MNVTIIGKIDKEDESGFIHIEVSSNVNNPEDVAKEYKKIEKILKEN